MACYNKDPSWNTKCIVLTALVALGYWFLPNKQTCTLISLAIGCVTALALYDIAYSCENSPSWKWVRYAVIPALACLIYWYAPKHNKWILFLMVFLPYLALAWYDYLFLCKRTLGPTYLSLFYAWAKPDASKQIKDYKNWCPDIKKRVWIVDGIIMALLVVAAPFYWKWKPA